MNTRMTPVIRLLGPVVLLLAAVMAARPSAVALDDPQEPTAVSFIYWTDQSTGSGNGEIWRSNPDGSGTTAPVVSGMENPRGIALDEANNQMYWVDRAADKLQRANLDGSNVITFCSGLIGPDDMKLDLESRWVYWSEPIQHRIRRSPLTGCNPQTVLDAADGLGDPVGIALDLANNRIYWTEFQGQVVKRANLDGTGVQTLISSGLGGPLEIALDQAAGQMYFIDSPNGTPGYGGKVLRASLSGTNVTHVGPEFDNPRGLAVDLDENHIYVVDAGAKTLKRFDKISGGNVITLKSGGVTMSDPRAVALDFGGGGGPTCYTLSRQHTGNGSNPQATPQNSTGCPANQYVAGASISVEADPDPDWSVSSWSGTTNNSSTSTVNTVNMPANNHTVTVNYIFTGPTCYALSRQHTGNGSNPQATPQNSTGCPANQYVVGASISVEADPDPDWSVGSWSGTTNNSSTSTVNTVNMPANNHTVIVNYIFTGPNCYTLSLQHTGQGSNPTANPTNSSGCPNGQYTANATISVSAVPSAGWAVTSWSGTTNNNSTSTSNTVVMQANNQTVIVHYGLTCYTLLRQHTGQGSDPTANPPNSTGCSAGQYSVGTGISLTADPANGWAVTGWTGTANDNSTGTTNSVVMPANNHTVIVHYGLTCYTLLRQHTGQGSDPTANPPNSTGCSAGQYTAGTPITLTADPADGWIVSGWSGANNGGAPMVNMVTMPTGHHTVIVSYVIDAPCYTLTRSHTGQGGDPIASPPSSGGCDIGEYKAGEVITLTADPALEWRVVGWNNTINNSSTATTNTAIMPTGDYTVSVTYAPAPCYALSLTHEGQGSNPTATPAQSDGCDPNTYHEGAVVALSADPAAGWEVSGWSGTIDNGSTATSNVAIMPDAAHAVKASYRFVPILDEHVYMASIWTRIDTEPTCYSGPNEKEPNNRFGEADANGPFCLGVDFLGRPADQWDVFVFNVEGTGILTVRVTNHRGQNGLLRLHNSATDMLAHDNNSADGFQVSHAVTRGRYYVSLFVPEPNVNEAEQYTMRAMVE